MLRFTVEGSAGDLYEIEARREGVRVHMTCTCAAGRKSMHCKHRLALLTGDGGRVRSDNAVDVPRLAELIAGSELQAALADLDAAERAVNSAKYAHSNALRKVGRLMGG